MLGQLPHSLTWKLAANVMMHLPVVLQHTKPGRCNTLDRLWTVDSPLWTIRKLLRKLLSEVHM